MYIYVCVLGTICINKTIAKTINLLVEEGRGPPPGADKSTGSQCFLHNPFYLILHWKAEKYFDVLKPYSINICSYER